MQSTNVNIIDLCCNQKKNPFGNSNLLANFQLWKQLTVSMHTLFEESSRKRCSYRGNCHMKTERADRILTELVDCINTV